MRKLLFIPVFFTILLSSAGELPWKSSTLWNQDSQPLPLTGKVRRLEKCGDDFMAATTAGVGIYSFKDGKYFRKLFRNADKLRNAVQVGKYIVFIDCKGLHIWDTVTDNVKSSKYFATDTATDHQFIMAPVKNRSEVIIGNSNRLWIVKTGKPYPHATKIIAKLSKSALAAAPDGSVFFYDTQKLYRYDGKFTEIPLPASFKQKEAFHLGISPDGKYLYFGAPFAVYDIKENKIVKQLPEINHIRYGYAFDRKRDTLYVGSWSLFLAISNASAPEKMEIIDAIDSMSEVTLYTHRDAVPCAAPGSILYLDKSDELLFAGDPGVTILGTSAHKSGLAEKLQWEKYKRDHKKYTGDTDFHTRLRKGKLVMGYTSSKYSVTAEALDNMKKNGVNAFVFNIFQIEHHKFYPPTDVRDTVIKVAKMCAQRDILFFANMTPYNISMNNTVREFRPLILPTGEPALYKNPRHKDYTQKLYPCLLDKEHIARAGFQYNMIEVAKLSKAVPIAGIIFEMGDGWIPTTFRAGMCCFCDHCFGEFFKSNKETVPAVPPARRNSYLSKNKKLAEYVKFMETQLEEICRNAAAEMRKINPRMIAGVMLPESEADYSKQWLYNAFIKGFQHEKQAVPVISEQTYAIAYVPEFTAILEDKYHAKGMEVILIPGIINYWLTPQLFFRRAQEYLKYTPAVLYYDVERWYKPFDNQKLYRPFRTLKNYREGCHTQSEYMALPDPLKTNPRRNRK